MSPRLFLPALVLALSCNSGKLTIGGNLWPTGDDDSAGDDDIGDDDTGDDDTGDDDTGDDDDSTPTGGPVVCGPGPADLSGDSSVYTGAATVVFEYEARGGFFEAAWSGCEARHYFVGGAYQCGIRWEATGTSYGEQFQATRLVSRFTMEFVVTDDTCGSWHPDSDRGVLYYRAAIPYEDGELEIRWSVSQGEDPADMDIWAELPFEGQGDEPGSISFEYSTEPEP
jgi:hypothetical protein